MLHPKSVWMQDKHCNAVQQYMGAIPRRLPFLKTGVNLGSLEAVLLAYYQLYKSYLLGHELSYSHLHIPS